MVIELSLNWSLLVSVISVLILFGVGYNALVDRLGERAEGYESLLVAGGCGVTLLGAAFIIGLEDAIIVIALFIASGTPMIVGEVARRVRMRSRG